MNNALQIQNITAMSSNDIAALTGKRHADVLRDIRVLLEKLYPDEIQAIDFKDNADLRFISFNGLRIHRLGVTNNVASIDLDQRHAYALVAGYSAILLMAVIDRWLELEAAEAKRKDLEDYRTFAEYTLSHSAYSKDPVLANQLVLAGWKARNIGLVTQRMSEIEMKRRAREDMKATS